MRSTENNTFSAQVRLMSALTVTTSIFAILATGALAGPDACSATSPGVYLCTGDQSEGVFARSQQPADLPPSITSLTVQQLTADLGSVLWEQGTSQTLRIDTGAFRLINGRVYLSSLAAQASNSSNLTLTGSGITTLPGNALPAASITRIGRAGTDTSKNGQSGGAGATGGNATLQFGQSSGGFSVVASSGSPAISASVRGGTGGQGGQIQAKGGKGGTGGAAGVLSFVTRTDVTVQSSGTGIFGQASGGAGRAGRAGKGFNGAGAAGAGGSGGILAFNGNQNSSQGSGSWDITTTADAGHGLSLFSRGGDGGLGGSAASSSSAPGGDGGIGGDAAAIWLYDAAPVIVTTSGAGAVGVLLRSEGGDGGDGGSGSNTAKDGSGNSGGNAGSINATSTFDITTTGQEAPGVALSAVGGSTGQAGRGGKRTFSPTAGQGGGTILTLSDDSTVQTSGDLSVGVTAQSIGGYGADAPDTVGLVTFAATGSSGGQSGDVNVNNAGDVTTDGYFAPGILAAGLGGGGGHGGKSFGLFYSSGGSGSHGGNGGIVTVFNSGNVQTGGASSTGIFAHSVGGTGGAGGNSGGMVALGGGASEGGNGNAVSVNHTGTISAGDPTLANAVRTVDDSDGPCPEGCAPGILAQSIGGGGGQGGSTGGWFAIGGAGDTGGAGGAVNVNVGDGARPATATITTYLDDSEGVAAQSIGGGGGNGGNAVAAGLGVSAAVGGGAGNGGTGGTTIYTQNSGHISTSGDRSHGVNAQSIGGGGGNGGFAVSGTLSVGVGVSAVVGGSGGGGGSADLVRIVANEGANVVSTAGDDANGIMAQSIAGGGGSGGFAVAATGTFGASGSVAISTAVGGQGAKGGTSGVIDVKTNATVTTQGDRSNGILAQSIGGGGGNGGLAVAGSFAAGEGSAAISVGVGGGASGGGSADQVSVTQSWSLSTEGTNSDGIVAQSIGGGGGNGGGAIAGSATVSGQSTSVNVTVGGGGGNGGKGGPVYVDFIDSSAPKGITTSGDLSDAIIAQSIGGGGGNGGFAAAGNLNFGGESNSINVAIGGSAGSGAASDLVRVTTTSTNTIQVSGNAAKGILAQSIAGGGGNGGMAITGSFTNSDGNKELAFALGGAGGSGGASGAVFVTSGSPIVVGSTTEDSPDNYAAQQGGNAIVAQSIGGSGGTGGLSASAAKSSAPDKKGNTGDRSLTVDIGGGGGGGGKTGEVTVAIGANTTTLGHLSDAVIVQSIGGSGGAGGGTINYADSNKSSKSLNLAIGGGGGGSAPSQDATVTMTSDANVVASGTGSRGVFVQSIGGNGGSGGANHFSVKDDNAPGDSLNFGIGGSAGSASNGGGARFGMLAGGSVITGSGLSSTPKEGSQLSGHAVMVQSIGGGGGAGGAGITGKVQTKGGDNSKTFNLGLGGQGSGGGESNTAAVGNVDGSTLTAIEGTIATSNWNSHGLFVQSVGGGGGDGGTGINGDISNQSKLGLNIGLGAGAGGGGAAGIVQILSNATVTVLGDNSKGIFAQSVGGGGGNGGIGINGDVKAGGGEGTKQLTFGLGAKGAGGGRGDGVIIENGGDITTATNATDGTTREMDAIFAQSVGGGGGNGGIGINGNVTSSDGSGGLELTLGIGNAGGSGGNGGDVSLTNSGKLSFAGDSSRGILAQSIGGGGGNGGAGIVGDLASASDKENSETKRNHINVGLGAKGGSAGQGGIVTVSNIGTIKLNSASGVETVNATGILAQSIGGGGGNSGIGIKGNVKGTENTRVANIGIGAQNSGSGDDAGTVTVTNGNTITIVGDAGVGIKAQSIGGGGGNGALGISGTVATGSGDDDDDDDKEGKAISFGLGGAGGAGADGNTVTVVNTQTIITGTSESAQNVENSDAHGIHAQSIGGGGGSGLVTGGLVYGNVNDEDTAKGINFNLGATGSNGGDGGSVSVENSGFISTAYIGSHAIFAQSIGGGGGNVGSLGGIGTEDGDLSWGVTLNAGGSGSKGSGSDVSVALSDAASEIFTGRGGSHGILAQSIGGGGGAGANTIGNTDASKQGDAKIAINLGGEAGSSGDGGTVTVNGGTDDSYALGTITTQGIYSVGILAQSIGGGGGLAGEALGTAEGSVMTLGAKGSTSANPSGNGSAVVVDFGGTIETKALASHGILAQSIGGGGGYGGRVLLDGNTEMGTGIDMGGDGTANGGGFTVTVNLSGATIKTGVGTTNSSVDNSAVGIFAQSVGGGGGLRGDPNGSLDSASVGSAGGVGGSAQVRISLLDGSTVETTSQYSHGIFAQAASGKDANSGQVAVTLAGGSSIKATGLGAAGIIAQTTGLPVNSNSNVGRSIISIEATSSVTGGLGSDAATGASNAAIWVRDGNANNSVTNAGTIASANGANGTAIRYTGSTGLTVSNSGTILGGFQKIITKRAELSATESNDIATHVVNEESGTIILGGVSTFDQITNSGTIFIAGEDEIGEAEITGNLVQTETGVLGIDLTPDGTEGDVLTIGGSAEIDGEIVLADFETAEDGPILGVGAQQHTFLLAGGEITLADTLTIPESAVTQVELDTSAAARGALALNYNVDFANDNIQSFTNKNQDRLTDHLHEMYLADALESALIAELVAIDSAEGFAEVANQLSAELAVDTQIVTVFSSLSFSNSLMSCTDAGGAVRYFEDGQCVYASLGGSRIDRDASSDNLGFSEDLFQFSYGWQSAPADDWNFGGALRYEQSDLSVEDASASSDGRRYFAGLSAKRRTGQWELAGAIHLGYGEFDTTRYPLPGDEVTGTQDQLSYGARLRASYLEDRGDWYLRPRVDLGATRVKASSFDESSSDGLALSIDEHAETYYYLQPSIEIGGDFETTSGLILRPRASLGLTQFLGSPEASADARFASAPSSLGSFETTTKLDRTRLELAAGIDVFTKNNVTFRADAFGTFSDNTTEYGGAIRLEVKF